MGRLGKIRNSFVNMRGGKLISIESVILALALLIVLLFEEDILPLFSVIVAVTVGFIFPILAGTFKFLAWITAIFFSLFWALLGFVIISAITDESTLIGLVVAVILFAISFCIHKDYSDLTFHNINNKTYNHENMAMNNMVVKENVIFCQECGRRITTADGRCDRCNR